MDDRLTRDVAGSPRCDRCGTARDQLRHGVTVRSLSFERVSPNRVAQFAVTVAFGRRGIPERGSAGLLT